MAMLVQVLTVQDCPSGPVLDDRLAEVLAGRTDVTVERRVIDTAADAELLGMHGSPTVLVDGHDPFAGPDAPASLSCRLYRDADGRSEGAPSREELRRVLGEQADCCDTLVPAASAGQAGRGRLAPVDRGWRSVHQAVLRAFAETGAAPEAAVLVRAAAPFGRPTAAVLADLAAEDFLTLDDAGNIVAAYPFSALPTGVEVILPGGVRVASMCAIDALGIPAMLGVDAVIESTDPVSSDPIQVSFHNGIASWQPETATVFCGARSGLGPAAAVCCGYVRFFGTRAAAEAFAAAHPEAVGDVLEQRAAQRLGEQIFGPLLTASA
jgi:hypothetical protein